MSTLSSASVLFGPGRVLLGEHLRQSELDLERDQVLLGAVVEVALQPPALLVLRRDQALARCAQVLQPRQQLGGEAHVLEHQPGLVGKVVEQLLLDRGQRLALALGDREGAQQLALVADLDGSVRVRHLRQRVANDP